jgi:hypothetical protein
MKREGISEAASRLASLAAGKNKARLKGSKAGAKKALIGIKAPAQGGEAGKGACPSSNMSIPPC